jgi:hypothetical protein
MEKGRLKAEFFFPFFRGGNGGVFLNANEIHLLSSHEILAHLLRVDIIGTLSIQGILTELKRDESSIF